MSPVETGRKVVVRRRDFESLFDALHRRGYAVIGPQRRDNAIVYDVLESVADLPAGWTDEQDAGSYRLVQRDDGALFGYTVGPTSWKRYLFPPELRLWRAQRDGHGIDITAADAGPAPRYAFLGVRACEIAAIAVQDRVFAGGAYVDPVYRARRDEALVIAVTCAKAGGTCFCASMGTGPDVRDGFDLALTELVEGEHVFIAEAGSERGADILADVPHAPASAAQVDAARRVPEVAAAGMGRHVVTDGLPALLAKNPEHPRWTQVAERCLSCGNCTMSCPTCFCHTVDDVVDLAGFNAERVRRWDSCFTQDFSYIHGGSVRPSTRSRYRQWLTHKLSSWHAQFGTSGCVGCGRCITWCPARIDITEEVHAIREGRPSKEERRADS